MNKNTSRTRNPLHLYHTIPSSTIPYGQGRVPSVHRIYYPVLDVGPKPNSFMPTLCRVFPCSPIILLTDMVSRSRLLAAHGLLSCLSVRTQPLTATGAPSQTSTIPYHAIPCKKSSSPGRARAARSFPPRSLRSRLSAGENAMARSVQGLMYLSARNTVACSGAPARSGGRVAQVLAQAGSKERSISDTLVGWAAAMQCSAREPCARSCLARCPRASRQEGLRVHSATARITANM